MGRRRREKEEGETEEVGFLLMLCRRFFLYEKKKNRPLTENQRRDAGNNSELRQSQAEQPAANDVLL